MVYVRSARTFDESKLTATQPPDDACKTSPHAHTQRPQQLLLVPVLAGSGPLSRLRITQTLTFPEFTRCYFFLSLLAAISSGGAVLNVSTPLKRRGQRETRCVTISSAPGHASRRPGPRYRVPRCRRRRPPAAYSGTGCDGTASVLQSPVCRYYSAVPSLVAGLTHAGVVRPAPLEVIARIAPPALARFGTLLAPRTRAFVRSRHRFPVFALALQLFRVVHYVQVTARPQVHAHRRRKPQLMVVQSFRLAILVAVVPVSDQCALIVVWSTIVILLQLVSVTSTRLTVRGRSQWSQYYYQFSQSN